MKKIIITGASGLLGKEVLKKLKRLNEYEVYAVTTKKEHLADFLSFNIVEADLTDAFQRKKIMEIIQPEIMIHLAWNQENADFRMSETNLQWLEISMDLLQLFEKAGGKKLLFAGSSSEYDGSEGIFAESVDVVPKSLYGLCKKTFNEFAKEYCKVRGIAYIGMRFFTIYGKGDSHSFGAIPYAVRQLSLNKEIICNSPETTRDYIFVEDAANVLLQLLKHDFCGIVNVASGTARSMQNVFDTIGRVTGKENLVKISTSPVAGTKFEADISLLKNLGIIGYYSDFEQNIQNVIKNV